MCILQVLNKLMPLTSLVLFLYVFSLTAASADTASEIAELKKRLENLEKKQEQESQKVEQKTDTIAQELEKTKLGQMLPEKAALKSAYGLGPAASSVRIIHPRWQTIYN